MNRKIAYVFLFVVLIILFSCKSEVNNETRYGSLNLQAETSRTIEPNLIEISCASYKAKGTHSDGIHTFEKSFTGITTKIDQLIVGEWSVYIEGYNSEGVLIAKSNRLRLTIQESQTTNASFQLSYLTEGNGTLALTVKVSASDSSVASVRISVVNTSDVEDILSIQKPVNAVDGYFEYSVSKSYPAGGYRISAAMLDGADNPVGTRFVESAIVYPNLTSERIWTGPSSRVVDPVITPENSEIDDETVITISSATEGAEIYYTIDGSTPTATGSSIKYTGPFTIDRSRTIKAIATKAGFEVSSVVTKEYFITVARMALANPIHYSLAIEVPEEWNEWDSVISGVCATLYASLTPTNNDAEYSWYIDGEPAVFNNGDTVGSFFVLELGTFGVHNIDLHQGKHIIQVQCKVGATVLTSEYMIAVSNSGAGSSGYNIASGDQGPAGGYIFYDKGNYSDGWRYLEAAPADLNGRFIWGDFGTFGTSTEIGRGSTNTELIVANSTETTENAANACLDYSVNGYADWFLPSKDELNLMYLNLKSNGIGCFADDYDYWSSSEFNATMVWGQSFSNGTQNYNGGHNSLVSQNRVRPVRAF